MDFSIDLPHGYRAREVWDFHSRDRHQLCEEVEAGSLRKRLMLGGQALDMEVQLTPGKAHIRASLNHPQATRIAERLLGLVLDPEPFEATFANDPHLGPLLQQRPGLRLAQTATPFEALTWAVMGQQVHLQFALQLRRTFIELADVRQDGRFYYPDAQAAARIDWEELPRRKFSRAKADTLRRVVELQLDLDQLDADALLAIKGIGPWTVNYTLMRGFGAADCSLHGDAAVKNALQRVFDRPLKASQAESILARYRPYRSLAAVHFWASLNKQA